MLEDLECLIRLVQAQAVGNDDGGVNFASFDELQQAVQVTLGVHLAGAQLQPFVHQST
jgi:hypothetical protein